MAGATLGAAIRQIHRLFDEGTVAGLTDGQLLDRFVEGRDERAFEALVHRHGPMVLGTARAVLKDRHSAEDAFQAAFATLARRAGAIRSGETLGGWLHRVAYREAVKLGVAASRRRALERRAVPADRPDDESRAIIHAELDRLPETFRLPVVLCDLEGLTKGQAAHSLGWTEATVRGRLERARALLRSRLARHGLGTSTGVVVASIGRESMAEGLVAAAVRSAMAMRSFGPGWIKLAVGIALAIGGMAVAGSGRPDEPSIAPEVVAVEAPAPGDGEPVEVVGRVVDPSGRPVAGASVRLQPYPTALPVAPESRATAGPDGRFAISGPRAAFKGRVDWGPEVYATAPGFGPGRAAVGQVVAVPGEVTVRLAADDVPVEGRVVDLEGRAVAGATVRVTDVFAPTGGTLDGWLEKVARVGSRGPWQGSNNRELEWLSNLPDSTRTTDAEGRFRLVGIGRDRIATLAVSGPTIASAEVQVATRVGPAIKTPDRGLGEPSLTYHAARFDLVAGPTRPIEGTVTDQDTGAPLAGVKVRGMIYDPNGGVPTPNVETFTDARGVYRLLGVGQAGRYQLFIEPSPGLPYTRSRPFPPIVPLGASTVRFDARLKRGVIVRGRITDRETGKPVPRAYLQTFAFVGNPNVAEFPGYRGSDPPSAISDLDGRFAVVALPGRGLLTARADFSRHIKAGGLEGIAGFKPSQGSFDTHPHTCSASAYHAIVEINPPVGSESIDRDVQVTAGLDVAGTVLDPEGRPIGALVASNLVASGNLGPVPHPSADFEAKGVDPVRPRRVFFYHEGRKLAGSAILPPKEPGPVTVRLQPWGSVTGRIVDDEGQPRPGYSLMANMPFKPKFDESRGFLPTNETIETGPDGRYRVDRLVPGLAYNAYGFKSNFLYGAIFKDVRVEPGEVKDVGDSKIVSFQE